MHVFEYPKGAFQCALHRRRNRWYIVLARGSGMASWRLVGTLNEPRPSDPATTAPPTSLSHLNHRFWFKSKDVKLDDLHWVDNLLLKVTGTSRPGRGNGEAERQVEVLVPEEGLCHRCDFCGAWESFRGVDGRWVAMEYDNGEPIYWCKVSEFCTAHI
jgi:hypothetical protein